MPARASSLSRTAPPPSPRSRTASAPMVSSDQAERLADLADGGAAAIGDHRAGDAGAVAAVFAVDVLDHLLAPLVLEIDVDVGRLVALGRDEAFEQQIAADRIDRGDAEAVADRGIGRRAAALAEDVLRARIAHDVVDGEEIGRVVACRDQGEFVGEALADRVVDALRIALARALPGQMLQRLLRGWRSPRRSRPDIRISVRRARR